jgi:hypothetical protein
MGKKCLIFICLFSIPLSLLAQRPQEKLLFGVAYYDEYMPYDQAGKKLHYYFNYSATPNTLPYPHKKGKELLSNIVVLQNSILNLDA